MSPESVGKLTTTAGMVEADMTSDIHTLDSRSFAQRCNMLAGREHPSVTHSNMTEIDETAARRTEPKRLIGPPAY